jgi:hypothetical protein
MWRIAFPRAVIAMKDIDTLRARPHERNVVLQSNAFAEPVALPAIRVINAAALPSIGLVLFEHRHPAGAVQIMWHPELCELQRYRDESQRSKTLSGLM